MCIYGGVSGVSGRADRPICPARLPDRRRFRNYAPPWVFCFAYGRQTNYAAARGGGAETAGEGSQ